VIATSFVIAITKKNMNEKRVADYDFAIATLKKRLQEKQTLFGKKDIC
jgi:hypothetical protein